jgi:hypothetical protein
MKFCVMRWVGAAGLPGSDRGIREGYENAWAGRMYSVKEVFDESHEKQGLPR